MKRFVRTLRPTQRAVGVFPCAPGAEGQIDFFRRATTLVTALGEWRRPWAFRSTLGHSRHGYEEAVWDQTLELIMRRYERASTMLTSNRPVEDWGKLLGDAPAVTALLDRQV